MKNTVSDGKPKDALCFCEYDNVEGQRQHILAMCCECDALDVACDRCIMCGKIPTEITERLCSTVEDRCRFPWRGGAVRLRLDIICPIALVPSSILLASLGPAWTVLAFAATFTALVAFYRLWRNRHRGNRRTRVFFVFGVTSIAVMCYTFFADVVEFRKIILWEILLLVSSLAAMTYYIVLARRDPGVICTESPSSPTLRHVSGWSEDQGGLSEFDVMWVDSRPMRNGELVTWCSDCAIQQPARSAHCSVCSVCIRGRDHHCIWIDACIGASNHRSFFLALLLFVVSGFYGAHLTMTTVCTPEIYLDWFLWPTDCRYVYDSFPSSVAFVSACYVYVAVAVMSLILLQQATLISQNLTLVEWRRAAVRGWTRPWLPFVVSSKYNVNDRGFYQNWKDFLADGRRQRYVTADLYR